MTMYMTAPEVEKIGVELIRTIPQHQPLGGVRVEFLFIEKAPRSKGRMVLGRARKVGGLAALLASGERPTLFSSSTPLFVVEISHDTWQRLDDKQRVALVDHELCHCVVDYDPETDAPILSIRGHDFEEFAAVVERHGLWSTSGATFGQALAEQLVLAIEDVTSFTDGLGDECGTDDGDPT